MPPHCSLHCWGWGSLCYHVSVSLVVSCHSLCLWLFSTCSVSHQFFFRRNYSINGVIWWKRWVQSLPTSLSWTRSSLLTFDKTSYLLKKIMKEGVEEGDAEERPAIRSEACAVLWPEEVLFFRCLSHCISVAHGSHLFSVSWVPPSMQCCPQAVFKMNIFLELEKP